MCKCIVLYEKWKVECIWVNFIWGDEFVHHQKYSNQIICSCQLSSADVTRANNYKIVTDVNKNAIKLTIFFY